MIEHLRFFWQLALLGALLALAGILLLPGLPGGLSISHYLWTLSAYLVINALVWVIMNRGILKKKREGAMILLAGFTVKFLLYLLYILLFWLLTKNITKAFVLAFFALYLIFTYFTIRSLFKLLKTKQLL